MNEPTEKDCGLGDARAMLNHAGQPVALHVYPVGLFGHARAAWMFRDWRRLRYGWRYLKSQARNRNWRAIRNYFNGYLAEHDGCAHNAGRGWTKRAARRRVQRLHVRRYPQANSRPENVDTPGGQQ